MRSLPTSTPAEPAAASCTVDYWMVHALIMCLSVFGFGLALLTTIDLGDDCATRARRPNVVTQIVDTVLDESVDLLFSNLFEVEAPSCR